MDPEPHFELVDELLSEILMIEESGWSLVNLCWPLNPVEPCGDGLVFCEEADPGLSSPIDGMDVVEPQKGWKLSILAECRSKELWCGSCLATIAI